MKARLLKSIAALVAYSSLILVFDNCSQIRMLMHSFNPDSNQAAGEIPHPPVTNPTVPPTQKTLLVHRTYVTELMRDIFTSTNHPVAGLDDLIQQWVYSRGAQFGQGCNPYDTYTSSDCGGDISNSSLSSFQDDGVIRESFHVQFCQNVLGLDEGVTAALEKISIDPSSVAPSSSGIAAAIDLFYRGRPTATDVTAALALFDQSLATSGETTLNRWRGVLMQICQSTDWELL